MNKEIEQRYLLAKEKYARVGVDTDLALKKLEDVAISVQCWQGDDIQGFISDASLSGGIQVTGNYPGKARNLKELQMDIEKAFSLIPGKKRLNLHAIYVSSPLEGRDIDQLEAKDFQGWIDWAKKENIGLDFNPTCFSHPMYKDNFTLASPDEEVRSFWVRHCKACVKIGDDIGRQLNDKCVTNIWIPDGMKDNPYSHLEARERLMKSLDEILATPYSKENELLAVESKFFGIGAESYTVGSSEFYLGYAIKNQIGICLDAGHFHPNEFISDKISSALMFVPELLLHVSRPVYWDSDHVDIFDDELQRIAQSLVRENALSRTHIGLDFFDATINRIASWVIGTRSTQKALLKAFLEPKEELLKIENDCNYTKRLMLTEELKAYPWGDVYNYFLESHGVKSDEDWYQDVEEYEKEVLSKRG
ncbi:MAG: L-rhamnose isomerase [Candidatus Enterosoma sp.]|nr:L-rhamnose isomerase [bacterium]MDY3210740.1 L-rhamnose isomerase [Candidatus Enterosoma sp.]